MTLMCTSASSTVSLASGSEWARGSTSRSTAIRTASTRNASAARRQSRRRRRRSSAGSLALLAGSTPPQR